VESALEISEPAPRASAPISLLLAGVAVARPAGTDDVAGGQVNRHLSRGRVLFAIRGLQSAPLEDDGTAESSDEIFAE
jgi:hypothetical protein